MTGEKKLSSSWHDSAIAVKPTHPQLLLYKAVFVGGVKDYLMPDTPGRRAWAEDWMFDDESTKYDPESFSWYCDRLGVDPVKAKARICDQAQSAELKRIIGDGLKVEELVIQFLKGDGVVNPRPIEPPRKHAPKREKLDL